VTCYISRLFTRPQAATHPSTNRAQCRLTLLIKPTPLTTALRRHPYRASQLTQVSVVDLWRRFRARIAWTQVILKILTKLSPADYVTKYAGVTVYYRDTAQKRLIRALEIVDAESNGHVTDDVGPRPNDVDLRWLPVRTGLTRSHYRHSSQ